MIDNTGKLSNITKKQFVDTIEGNYKFMSVASGIITLVLLLSVTTSNFIVTTGRSLPRGFMESELPADPEDLEGREAQAHEYKTKKERKAAEKKAAVEAIAQAAIEKDKAAEAGADADGHPVDADGNRYLDSDGKPLVDAEGNQVDNEGNILLGPDGEPLGEPLEFDTEGNLIKKSKKKRKNKKKKGKKGRKKIGVGLLDGEGNPMLDTEGNPITQVDASGDLLEASGAKTFKKLFKQLDADGNGTLDSDEVKTMMTTLGKDLTESEFAIVMAKIDADGSGDVSFDEFLAFNSVSDRVFDI